MKKEGFYYLFSMQLFSTDAVIFSILPLENIKKRPQKLLIIGPKLFFHKKDPAAQTSPELIFHIIKCREQASVLLSVYYSQIKYCHDPICNLSIIH